MARLTISLSLPRTASVALLRSVDFGGQYDVLLHEPTVRSYDRIHFPEFEQEHFIKGWTTYEQLTEFVLSQLSANKRVFIKDMVFSAKSWVPELIKQVSCPVQILLWIREPGAQLQSFMSKAYSAPVETFYQTSRLQDLLDLYTTLAPKIPTFICDHGRMNYEYMQRLGLLLKLPGSLGSEFWVPCTNLDRYYEGKKPESVRHWHGDAMASSGFGAKSTGPKIRQLHHRVEQLIVENMTVYNKLLLISIK